MLLYTKLTKRAMHIAYDYFKERVDKGGLPYIYHLVDVASEFQEESHVCVALLHDLLEDTEYNPDALEVEFGDTITNAIKALTRKAGTTYKDYIEQVCTNEIACRVKLADLESNKNKARILAPGEPYDPAVIEYESLLGRYDKAIERVREALHNLYLSRMEEQNND